ncbi:hypothetical protein UA08_05841 [Talaromyces atroroseus]|uniref:Hemerythrin-like domain-containing protein n=1 Tax=Talaromyces atroroseus TaxID=1441469 RepID=A0A225AEA1_TALAT|nr:hypothetical protein UA08_05841 [Talaromyces atroroseus]OKL58850.1 hypothetical protein UA08_05841 [Talaromyces atroroseus]
MAPPMYTDHPLAVIHTPKFETGKTDPFTIEASHMALSHNSFIRGFNSIYQQAPRVSSADKEDFVGYCLAWHDVITEHHRYEETDYFPNVDKAAGKTGLMAGSVHEHEDVCACVSPAAFHDGMERFKNYLLKEGVNFQGTEIVAIMDSFKDPFYSHLKSEPRAILELSKYNTPETPINITEIAGAAGKKTMTFSFVLNVLPVFLLNMDTLDFEDGMWHEVFPPVKGMVKWIMTKAIPMRHSGRWRFASCSPEGRAKQLEV